ncbi:MAG: class I SAM-dependent methyltransferase [Psychroserpens sp.]|nr:class I SAM-dependent methyltransferase [Psychroserpens sp.]
MSNSKSYLTVKDHSVSQETFELIPNTSFGFLETIPQPSVSDLPRYYESEDYISHTDTSRNLFEKVYQMIRSIALKKKLNLINSFHVNGKSLLDFGAGTGDFLKLAHKHSWDVKGIEPNFNARNIANKKTSNSVLDSNGLTTFSPNSFNVITLWHVLEHLPDLQEKLIQLKNLLSQDGRLVIAVPNYKSFDAEYYNSFWAAYDVPRHLWHFSQNSMTKLLAQQGLIIENILPMYFDSFYVSLLSEKYKTGHMNFIKAFWIGLRSNWKAKRSGQYSSLIYIVKKGKN